MTVELIYVPGTLDAMRDRPLLPADLEAKWERLLAVTGEREKAQEELAAASTEARALVVELLRAGVDRKWLIGRPFSSRAVWQIQQEEGLFTRSRRSPEE